MSATDNAQQLVFDTIQNFIDHDSARDAAIAAAPAALPEEVMADIDIVIPDRRTSYRDGLVIQFSFGLVDPDWDITRRPTGGRTLGKALGLFLADRHIPFVKDAYQNIGKNSEIMVRGNFAEFDRLLTWGQTAPTQERQIAFDYTCARIAATARPVLPMPELNRSTLTFARTAELLLGLVEVPSQGAYDQFTTAALLQTLVAEHDASAARVETKNLNASDKSSRAAGDVQILAGSHVLEAFEVTANNWSTKIDGASKTIRDNDLSRLHVIARRPDAERAASIERLKELTEDVAVLDVRQVIEVLAAALTRPQRADALVRLYELLDRYQPDVERVNAYVRKLNEAGLVERGSD
ncbi:hypothetical protein K3759_12085 [Sulfitobacter sp. W027]|uniref:hypothetical protein n=1 Tax=Sulfitobacter sp. W027 TaxID=2867025 RepID=UPI0021A341EA|nr:hypothetical protein [Sulfitobacter sp. W027]UWR32680.1 hypothetical protein K3759_12085 [Sulfitobacter sp. W027]